MDKLFYDSDKNIICADDIKESLLEIGASDCEFLFIHSDIMFGMPVEGFKRRDYLYTLYEIMHSVGIRNLIIPTFTYSFCNKEDYDIANSKTTMGAFNEYVRKMDNRYRTDDPLLSISVPIEIHNKFKNLSNHSLGEGSALDIIHGMDNVKFLFFGAEMADCFTYVHYVEKMMNVPYRFDKSFEGVVRYPDGREKLKKQIINTQCKGAKLPDKYTYFEDEMEDRGFLRKKRLADKYISCISEKDAYREIKRHISDNINYYLAEPFVESELIYEYTYDAEKGRITHC